MIENSFTAAAFPPAPFAQLFFFLLCLRLNTNPSLRSAGRSHQPLGPLPFVSQNLSVLFSIAAKNIRKSSQSPFPRDILRRTLATHYLRWCFRFIRDLIVRQPHFDVFGCFVSLLPDKFRVHAWDSARNAAPFVAKPFSSLGPPWLTFSISGNTFHWD